MPFQEKSAWVLTLVTLAVGFIYGGYLMQAEGLATPGLMLPMIILFIMLTTVFHIIVAIINPKSADTIDERDRNIERKGGEAGGFVLGGFVLVIMALAMINGEWLIANLAFIGMLTSELVKALWQVTLYRLSA
ncbi:hypothetical protein [Parvularcula sp. IMCC14364]|uniref:hypothetical protein n=1 Tax=Parvularcula sp. IMCC14364 TaxID=3067902 RepID=UPI0027404E60|nr:hypothetical protein [Parvularcula sp. IMCC14364]